CGHATLAAALVLFDHENQSGNSIDFYSPRSGNLRVTRKEDLLTMNFPADTFSEVELSDELLTCFDIRPQQAFKGKTDYMLVFENEGQIREVQASLAAIAKLDARGAIITAP